MKSKSRIEKKLKRKTNKNLVETIIKAKKNNWLEVADLISKPRRKSISLNLDQIDEQTEQADTVVVPGKVLGQGNVSKKLRIVALNFSKEAREKLREKNCEIVSIDEEIEKNPKAQGIKILKNL